MHVIDVSAPDFEEQMEVVQQTLRDIDAGDKPQYLVFNKIDRYEPEPWDEFSLKPKGPKNRTLEELKAEWIDTKKIPCIFISALSREGLPKLRDDIYKMVAEIHAGRYPFNNFFW